MNPRHRLHDAFVLHRRPFRNSSYIVDLMTQDEGKVAVIARGSRGGQGGSLALLQPFRLLQVGWGGRGELKNLHAVEPKERGYALTGRRMFCGLYANELMVRLLHCSDPHPEIYHLYQQLITALSDGAEEGRLLRSFEVQLLEQVGFGIDLHQDSAGAPIDAQQRYCYHPEEGMVRLQREGHRSLAVTGKTLEWLRMTSEQAESSILVEAKQLLRRVIDAHIPGELQSRKLMAQYSTIQ